MRPRSARELTYVLPLRRWAPVVDDELPAYLATLVPLVAQIIVVDGSAPAIFAEHAERFPVAVTHVPVDADRAERNGKVAGVWTAMRRVRTDRVVIADDDVRYTRRTLARIVRLLDDAEIVRPQNVFAPAPGSTLPWHALLDTGRTLIARATGGDWPGTLALRTAAWEAAGGYDGDVLFENLELVRSVRASGGRERRADDCFVARRPPQTMQYLRQRVRQAYDEFARPGRLAMQLAIAPVALASAARFGVRGPAALALGAIALAEIGRRRASGVRAFPLATSLLAPCWVAERAITAWCALAVRLAYGGVRYGDRRLRVAAHSERVLRARRQATTAEVAA